MQGTSQRRLAAVAVVALVALACGSGTPTITTATTSVTSSEAPAQSTSTAAQTAGSSTTVAAANPGTTAPPANPDACAPTAGAQALAESDRVGLSRIHDADGITIDAALYPHPDYSGNPWSQWGEGIVGPNGRFYSAIGDHFGADGNSYVYEYDPSTNELVLLTDVLGTTPHNDGAWGFGKIHAQMVLGPCGEIYYATYWGSRRGLSYSNGYAGDVLFHIDPAARTVTNHGVPEPERGFPVMASAPGHGLIYTIGVEPESNAGTFLVIDTATNETVFSTPAERGYRSIAVDAEGRAHFNSQTGRLAIYDPTSNDVVDTYDLPGDIIRAAQTLPDGTIFGVTQGPNVFFNYGPQGLQTLEEALGYTTSVAHSPLGGEIYYLPGAHGNSSANGAILKAVDPATGAERDVIALAPIVEAAFGAVLGGTYNLVYDEAGNRLYLGANIDPTGNGNGFGEVALLVIGLP